MISERLRNEISGTVELMNNQEYKDIIKEDIERGLDLVQYIIKEYNFYFNIDRIYGNSGKQVYIEAVYEFDKDCLRTCVIVDVDDFSKISTVYKIAHRIIYDISQRLIGGELNE